MKRYPFKIHFHNKEYGKEPHPGNYSALCTRTTVDKITLNEDEVTCHNCLVRMGKREVKKRNVMGKYVR